MSFFFYDYETTGIDPKRDRILQFAGVRTDDDFNIISEPICNYSKLSAEIIPHPQALLVTSIAPQTLNTNGLTEPDFIDIIHQEFAAANTCVVGYNNIRFDDEFTRYAFYRNFYDPYAREWQNNNSRWDLIDVVRMCAALRPEGINWPHTADNKITFKLEELTKANNLEHLKAHDALSDVYASIAIAKLIKIKQPRLFSYLLNTRKKDFVNDLIDVNKIYNLNIDLGSKLIVHSSRMIGNEYYATSVFLPLIKNSSNPNEIIAWDLRYNPEILFNLHSDVDYAKRLLYSTKDELAPNEVRLNIKSIHCNKSPAVAPINTLNRSSCERLQLNQEIFMSHAQEIIKNKARWFETISLLYSEKPIFDSADVEHDLYKKFISNPDKYLCLQFVSDVNKGKADLKLLEHKFSDERLKELLFRYKARNYPDMLNSAEINKWREYCLARLNNVDNIAGISKEDFISASNQIINSSVTTKEQKELMISWLTYINKDELICQMN